MQEGQVQFHVRAKLPDGTPIEYDGYYDSGFEAVQKAIAQGCASVVAHPVKKETLQ